MDRTEGIFLSFVAFAIYININGKNLREIVYPIFL